MRNHTAEFPRNLCSLAEAYRDVTDKSVHYCTLLRWAQKGVGGVRLRSWVVGGRRLTNREAVLEFIETRSEQTSTADPVPVRSENKKRRDIERAERELESIRG